MDPLGWIGTGNRMSVICESPGSISGLREKGQRRWEFSLPSACIRKSQLLRTVLWGLCQSLAPQTSSYTGWDAVHYFGKIMGPLTLENKARELLSCLEGMPSVGSGLKSVALNHSDFVPTLP